MSKLRLIVINYSFIRNILDLHVHKAYNIFNEIT